MRLFLVFLLAAAQAATPASAKPFSCQEFSFFATEIARARDRGIPFDVVRKAIIDGNFTTQDEKHFTEMSNTIYLSSTISPEIIQAIAFDSCRRARS
ncbi:hypothetical protein D3C81_1937390 [compost metagenome]